MTSSTRERRYLLYIAESIERIRRYRPETYQEFEADHEAQDAVSWRLQTLADAARNHLSDDLKARHPEIPWRSIYGFRNIAAHGYASLNLELVWEILSGHLDGLEKAVREELRSAIE